VRHDVSIPSAALIGHTGCGRVIPDVFNDLQSIDFADMDSMEFTSDTRRLWRQMVREDTPEPTATADCDAKTDEEHVYGVYIGTQFNNQYMPETWVAGYPHLFPYGTGAPGSVKNFSLIAFFRRAMQLVDDRFRKDRFFLFDVFATQQKRDVSNSARLVFERKSWERLKSRMENITTADVLKAVEEEEKGKPVSDERLRDFFRTASVTRSHAIGSDSDRHANRQFIWGISTVYSKPSIWLTINPVDHHDPIAAVLVGEDIDLDDFIKTGGPSAGERSRKLVADPFAAAEYFHIIISAVLEFLIATKSTERGVHSEMGVLGLVTAYFAMVEAQGRAALHLHCLLWLANTPDCSNLRESFRDPNFLERMNAYIRQCIRAHVEGLSTERGLSAAPAPHPSWSRPPNPHAEDWATASLKAERAHVEASQFHKCTPYPFGCEVHQGKGKLTKCKRGFPFELSPAAKVENTGHWVVR
jgi:hypothetical protein